MIAAIIENGIVINVALIGHLNDYPLAIAIDGRDCGIGYTWDGQTFSKPRRDFPIEQADKVAAIKAKRIQIAEGGLEINGQLVPTDKEALILFTSALDYLADKPSDKAIKRAGLGTLTKSQIKQLFDAVGALHEQAFNRESDLYDQIMAAQTVEELDSIDIHSGWPSQE